jgi:hypothetical protein
VVVALLTVALAIAALLVVVLPLIQGSRSAITTEAADDPIDEARVRLLADLDDAETAFHTGRLSHRDFTRVRAEIDAQLSEVLGRLDERERAAEALIEEQLATLRSTPAAQPSASGNPGAAL